MDIGLQIQIEAMKKLNADEGTRIRYTDIGDGFIYFSDNGFSAVRIPEKDFWLDKSKLKKSDVFAPYFELTQLDNTYEINISSGILDEKGSLVSHRLTGETISTIIDGKLFKKMYNRGCKIYAKSNKSPIHFVQDGTIYAVCMPIIK